MSLRRDYGAGDAQAPRRRSRRLRRCAGCNKARHDRGGLGITRMPAKPFVRLRHGTDAQSVGNVVDGASPATRGAHGLFGEEGRKVEGKEGPA